MQKQAACYLMFNVINGRVIQLVQKPYVRPPLHGYADLPPYFHVVMLIA